MEIKVGYCVAYDWQLLEHSIPRVYAQADAICLSVDQSRKSWSGSFFSWDEKGFREMLKRLDTLNKIKVYEDDFYVPEMPPSKNEVMQRNKMASFMGVGGWHIQLDADEYFINFGGFVNYLRSLHATRPVNVCCPMINLYKQLEGGMLWIKPETFEQTEFFAIATRHPHYEYGRRNGNFDLYTGYAILHQSWARKEEEVWEKLNNWGHSKDFDVTTYFELWKTADKANYGSYKNFHHLKPEAWPSLAFAPGDGIHELATNAIRLFPLPITKNQLRRKNSIWLSRLRKLKSLLVNKQS